MHEKTRIKIDDIREVLKEDRVGRGRGKSRDKGGLWAASWPIVLSERKEEAHYLSFKKAEAYTHFCLFHPSSD